MSVGSEEERLARLAEEVNEVSVVARTDVREARVCRAHVRTDRRLEELAQRSLVVRQRLHGASLAVDGAGESRAAERAATQDVRQDGRTQDVLDKQRYDVGELVLAERVTQRARPVDVVDGGVRVLVVDDVDATHREQCQLVGTLGVATVLHVARDREQLRRVHDVLGSIDHDLVGRLERDRVLLAECERAQGAVRGVLRGALQREGTRARRQLLLLVVAQAELDRSRHDACSDST